MPALKSTLMFIALAIIAVAAVPCLAQDQTTPERTAGDRVTISSSEVRLDLVVKDKKYRTVKDLTPSDVEVYEDGVRQDIQSFRLVNREEGQGSSSTSREGAGKSVTVPAPAAAGEISTVAVIFDRLSPEGRKRAHDAALAYVDAGMKANNFVGVFTTGLSLDVLQPYTTDATQVRAAIDKAGVQANTTSGSGKSNREQVREINESLTGINQEATSLAAAGNTVDAGIVKGRADGLLMMRHMLESFETLERNQQGRATAYALLAVVDSMREQPGRKAVLFFSEGVAIPADVQALFQSVIAAANRAGVSVYSVDAAGLRVESARAETRKEIESRSAQRMSSLNEESQSGPMTKDLERNEDILRLDPQSGLGQLADQTGGFLIRDSNDLRGRMGQIDEDMRAYYLLSYAPKNHDYDGRFRKVEIKSKRSGLIIQARKGYFAIDPTMASSVLDYEAPAIAAAGSANRPHEVAIRATALSFPEPARPGLVAVVAEVPSSAVTFNTDEKKKQYATDFSVVALVRDARRQVVRKLSRRYQMSGALNGLDAARKEQVLFYTEAEIDPGTYTVDTIAYDALGRKAGITTSQLEVPDASAGGLRVSSLALVERGEQLPPAEQKGDNPFRVADLILYPNMDETPHVKAGGQLPFFFTVYKAADGAAPSVTIEILQGGQPVGRTNVNLPAPDALGRMQIASALPLSKMKEGAYELKVTASNGKQSVVRSVHFTVGG